MSDVIEIVGGFGEALSLPSESVDIVYLRQVLHHASDLEQLIKECARILKRGGVFLACREHVVDNDEQLAQFLRDHPVHQLAGGENAFSAERYESAIRKAGLEDVLVLLPWDSVICVFPMLNTQQELKEFPKVRLKARFGVFGTMMSWIPACRRMIIRRYNSQRNPGRMYSFRAAKK